MAQSNSFNIADLYQKVFGITGVRFAIPDASNNIANTAASAGVFAVGQVVNEKVHGLLNSLQGSDPFQVQTIPMPVSNITSVLGTPIYEQIVLTIPAIITGGKVTSPQKTYTLPDWPLFDITGQRNIIKTPMQGKDGTVKEYISDDDYLITIRGFLINYDSPGYPEQQLQELMQVINAKVAIGITSQVFNLLDIHNIVIERWSFPAVEGYENMQPFELECTSDQPVELEIKSVKTKKAITPGL
jgi:hypothetical protein